MNAPQRSPSTFTNAEFERLVRSGGFGDARVELRRGMIVKMNAQHLSHARAKTLLAKAIEHALGSAQLTWLVYQEVSVDFAEGFQPLPDIVVWDPVAVSPDLDGPLPGKAVRLVIEVADATLGDDLGAKLEDYAGAGLAEYWVVDLKSRLILTHTGAGGRTYARREPARFGDRVASLIYSALTIDTRTLS